MAEVKRYEFEDMWVEIDRELCVAAGKCVEICPADVYEIVDGRVQAERIADCVECGDCEGVCPTDAILDHFAW